MSKLALLLLRGAAMILWLLISQTPSTCCAHARCVAGERNALLSFKASLFDPAGRLSSWHGDDCCQWKGVRCSNKTGNVVALNLRNTNISCWYFYDGDELCLLRGELSLLGGELSSSLIALQHLRHLDLSCNFFNGTSIPVFMGSFKNLRYLNLSGAHFSGTIPSQLGNLSSLQYLDVSRKNFINEHDISFMSSIDLSWLPRLTLLRHLDMASVDLSSVRNWVHVVNMLPALQVLRLSDCSLNHAASKLSHSNLTNLEVLDLSFNQFSYTPLRHNWFWDLTSLEELYLSEYAWFAPAEPIPDRLGNMSALRVLDLSYSSIVGLFPKTLENMCNLQVLRMDGNNIDADLREFMERLPMCSLNSLEELNLEYTNMSGTFPTFIHKMSNLSVLLLSTNMLVSELPAGVGALGNLKILGLSNNNFSGLVPLGAVSSLDTLDLSYNKFSGFIPLEIGVVSNLKELFLSYNNFSGPTTSWIGALGNLEMLDLCFNNFNGPVPLGIGAASQLKELHLSNNNFSGPAPSWVGALGNLKILDLSYNNFSGPVPLGIGAVNLEILYLINNKFSGFVPLGIGAASHLKELYLSYNNFSSPVPSWIGALGNLEILDLSHNSFSGPVPLGIGSLSNLTNLDLSYNRFQGVISEENVERLSRLEYLDLSYNNLKIDIHTNSSPPFKLTIAAFRSCQLGPRFPLWLRWQTDIDVLVLENTKLDDVIPDWFWVTFSRASFLQASGNMLHGSLPPSLEHISVGRIYLGSNLLTGQVPQLPISMTRLNLSSNFLSGPLPSLKAPLLEELLLANNQISGSIPPSMCRLIGLKRLDLSGNKITGNLEQMQCWKESDNTSSMTNINSGDKFGSNMLSLALNHNELSGEFPQFLQSASQLLFLDLSYNRFFGSLPKWLPEIMQQLQILRLRSNNFSGHIPKKLTHLDRLHYLDIAKNNISGTIPEDLARLKAMTVVAQNFESYIFEESIPVITKDQQRDYTFGIYNQLVNLDFSCNNLIGHIPEEIHLLMGLTNLNLSRNQFSGTIPSQFGDLKQLESLDLSYNEFSGKIPSSLSALTSLSHLNLSYNNLSGEIPSGPQLQALDNPIYIYIGNPGLCGHPLPNNCSNNKAKQSDFTDRNHVETLYLGMGIGFVIGLWTVFCTMLMKRTWMMAYFRIIDKLYDKAYVHVSIRWNRLKHKRQDFAA